MERNIYIFENNPFSFFKILHLQVAFQLRGTEEAV